MWLAYYKDRIGNFGDDLNPWLWDQLLPGMIDGAGPDVLLGMGTLMDNWFIDQLPPARHKFVLGAGGGMTPSVPELDASWRIYGVRGPLTASYFGLDQTFVLTDPAMCLNKLWKKPVAPRTGIGFMPHHYTNLFWDWRAVCESVGLIYLDPHQSPLSTVDQINRLEKVICESMHAAIVADALRVPWVPVRINALNYTGKWDDWGASLGLPVQFSLLPFLIDPQRAAHMGEGGRSANNTDAAIDNCRRALHHYAHKSSVRLSNDQRLDRALSRFFGALDLFKGDWSAGVFSE